MEVICRWKLFLSNITTRVLTFSVRQTLIICVNDKVIIINEFNEIKTIRVAFFLSVNLFIGLLHDRALKFGNYRHSINVTVSQLSELFKVAHSAINTYVYEPKPCYGIPNSQTSFDCFISNTILFIGNLPTYVHSFTMIVCLDAVHFVFGELVLGDTLESKMSKRCH